MTCPHVQCSHKSFGIDKQDEGSEKSNEELLIDLIPLI